MSATQKQETYHQLGYEEINFHFDKENLSLTIGNATLYLTKDVIKWLLNICYEAEYIRIKKQM